MKTRLIALVSLVILGFNASAYEMGAVVGIQSTNVKATGSGVTASDGTGLRVGILGLLELQEKWSFRTGVIYTERKFSIKTDATDAKMDFKGSYLDIPLTGLYMMNESFGFFGGAELGLKASASCSNSTGASCSVSEAESLLYGLEFGGHFRFVPNFGIEVGYLLGLSDIGEDVEKPSGLSLHVMYLF